MSHLRAWGIAGAGRVNLSGLFSDAYLSTHVAVRVERNRPAAMRFVSMARTLKEVSQHALHQIEIEIVNAEGLERDVDGVLRSAVVRAPKLGNDKELVPGDARVFDTGADLALVACEERREEDRAREEQRDRR